jgi:RHS repeat-associated protein
MRVAMQRGTEGVKYLLGDHLGSASVALNADGTQLGAQGYRPWGAVNFTEGTIPTEYTFTGQFSYVSSFGMMYFNARWFLPYLNRWAQPDSIIPEPGNVQAYDRYAYTVNNPIKYSDPSGHWIETALDIAFIIFDIQQIYQEGWTPVNAVALAADIACAIVPFGTGGGPAVRVIMAGGDAALAFAKTATKVPDVVRVGQLLEKLFQFASSSSGNSSDKKTQGHHPWPKYLLGPENQNLYGLSKKLHTEYHSQLDKFLDRKLGKDYFQAALDSPEKINELLEALLEFNKYFDETYETQTYEALEDVLKELGLMK